MRSTLKPGFILLLLIGLSALWAQSPYNAPGDTLTLIQQPLLNIPAIQIPGETLQIICLAPQNTTGWQAELKHGRKTIPLQISSIQELQSPFRWLLNATIPSVQVFELYDLRVRASGGLDDTAENAVQVVPTRKSSYYFVHITDSHMPGRIFYPDYGYQTDSTSVDDFRAVVQDINLIRPEFVLFTGDIVNEGELEGFAGMYSYGWAQRAMAELEVPVYLTAGNHDIGGWNDTPPPSGSSRRNWWKYFGWSWLDNADSNWHTHTQNYSFTYGPVHYIGLEAYDNYDNFRSYIYGGQSFIYSQLNWLDQELSLHPDKTKVLFHHYDFSDQLDLNSLGVSMALWGHIHSNNGNINTFPYNLATRSVCDGNRAYRIIRVNGNVVTPTTTIYANNLSGVDNLTVSYSGPNNGSQNSLSATVNSSQSQTFEAALLKFIMPFGNNTYNVSGGELEQVDRSGDYSICYVRFNLPAYGSRTVSISISGVASDDPSQIPDLPLISALYPNPFSESLNLRLSEGLDAPTRLEVFNQRGALLRSFLVPSGTSWNWDGKTDTGSDLAPGIYFIRAQSGKRSQVLKAVKTS